ncbi:MAG: DUF924 domain-containing protein [Burkholderiales bacterium]|nr:DUF924 domain-containing protein [Burkholderiales bacterium]
MNYTDIIVFWFEETDSKRWFTRDEAFDRVIRERFASVHEAAVRCECEAWRSETEGRLAEIIVLDQFSRNLFRDSARAFAYDGMALALAQEAVRVGADWALPPARKAFFYMPYMHSESRLIHVQAEKLFSQPGLEHNYDYELKHKAIIDRFGRYPHRNRVLGRESTPEELAFLAQPGSSF